MLNVLFLVLINISLYSVDQVEMDLFLLDFFIIRLPKSDKQLRLSNSTPRYLPKGTESLHTQKDSRAALFLPAEKWK